MSDTENMIEFAVYEIGGSLNTRILVPETQEVVIFEQDQMDKEGNPNGVVGQFGFPIEGIPMITQILASIYIQVMTEGDRTIN